MESHEADNDSEEEAMNWFVDVMVDEGCIEKTFKLVNQKDSHYQCQHYLYLIVQVLPVICQEKDYV